MPPLPPSVPQMKLFHAQFVRFGFGPGPGHGVPLLFLVLLGLVVVAVVAVLMRGRTQAPTRALAGATAPINDSVRILDERFARGDVDVDDYKVRRELLTNHP